MTVTTSVYEGPVVGDGEQRLEFVDFSDDSAKLS
jgi:hypothetical protein